ncbi:MAG: hypothetical protein OXJ37_03590 [Bryobacterales bacterium]|nr:hypothetical protein [Bryobacterales bacterium]MDE0621585.1 hypothetical protein [Bryobacterales bacterium]
MDTEWINLIEGNHPALRRALLAAVTAGDKSYLASIWRRGCWS